MAECVHLCRVSVNTVLSHMFKGDAMQLGDGFSINSYNVQPPLTVIGQTCCHKMNFQSCNCIKKYVSGVKEGREKNTEEGSQILGRLSLDDKMSSNSFMWVTEGGDLSTADWGCLAGRCVSLCLQAARGGRVAGGSG